MSSTWTRSALLCAKVCFPHALGLAVAVVAFGLGFKFGSEHPLPADERIAPPGAKQNDQDDISEDEEEEENAEDIPDGDLSTIQAGFLEPCKLVLVVRTDLKMTSGKIAAQ
ncbi:hypothetical protein DXG03_006130 [Asterophora parasitica]|uniref:peptidyl-tRNA hydrolase n=1 Tax=Asterophora parasitica TaxID=117018 RepID=A0A9P7GIY7_9AGAR|nr:hypothetical protein DXG03_006130 [Asterophora parasitica]